MYNQVRKEMNPLLVTAISLIFMVPAQLGLPTRWVLIFRIKTAIFDLEMSGFESLRMPAFMWGTQARVDGG